jgi:hypothetical protein
MEINPPFKYNTNTFILTVESQPQRVCNPYHEAKANRFVFVR